MTDMNLDEIEKLAERLWIKGGMIQMGERIEYGSDSAVMAEAATALTNMAERVRELEDAARANALEFESAARVADAAVQFCGELCEDSPDVPDGPLRLLHQTLDDWEGIRQHVTEALCPLFKQLSD
jgi:hypothetical protein